MVLKCPARVPFPCCRTSSHWRVTRSTACRCHRKANLGGVANLVNAFSLMKNESRCRETRPKKNNCDICKNEETRAHSEWNEVIRMSGQSVGASEGSDGAAEGASVGESLGRVGAADGASVGMIAAHHCAETASITSLAFAWKPQSHASWKNSGGRSSCAAVEMDRSPPGA